MGEPTLDRHGRYWEGDEFRFASEAAIRAWGSRYGGFGVLHRDTGMFDQSEFWTWHRKRRNAVERLKLRGIILDERVIVLAKSPRRRSRSGKRPTPASG